MTIDLDYTIVWFPASLLKSRKTLINMRDDDARTVRLCPETFCNNGGHEAKENQDNVPTLCWLILVMISRLICFVCLI